MHTMQRSSVEHPSARVSNANGKKKWGNKRTKGIFVLVDGGTDCWLIGMYIVMLCDCYRIWKGGNIHACVEVDMLWCDKMLCKSIYKPCFLLLCALFGVFSEAKGYLPICQVRSEGARSP